VSAYEYDRWLVTLQTMQVFGSPRDEIKCVHRAGPRRWRRALRALRMRKYEERAAMAFARAAWGGFWEDE